MATSAISRPESVRAALEEQRVEALLPAAGRDGDAFEDAVERAAEQSADILVLRHHPELEEHGGIAALLRC